MTEKKEPTEEDDFKIPLGAELELTIGNFAIVMKTNKGESLTQLIQQSIAVYEHVLLLNDLNVDQGVQ